MPNSDLIPSLLSKLYENQLALEASIIELSNWVGLYSKGVSAPALNVILESWVERMLPSWKQAGQCVENAQRSAIKNHCKRHPAQ
ncbi:hypothetical protein [Pseudomonas sp. JAI120]|uniref:hypothetical protein n=1 Tax=Pseudomonas sp. JAI120 TaxID=2723063 RepID=UPI00403F9D5B